jgi:hypothetical protein
MPKKQYDPIAASRKLNKKPRVRFVKAIERPFDPIARSRRTAKENTLGASFKRSDDYLAVKWANEDKKKAKEKLKRNPKPR